MLVPTAEGFNLRREKINVCNNCYDDTSVCTKRSGDDVERLGIGGN